MAGDSDDLPVRAPGGELARFTGSQTRATDADRERSAERLRRAYADGCLSEGEFEERIVAAFAARTRGDLRRLTRDLPRDLTRLERAGRAAFHWHAVTYVTVNSGLVAAWAATGGPFWPAGSLGPWGAFLALHAYGRRRMRHARERRAGWR
jgi:Domain of unknown function (DUF1707)